MNETLCPVNCVIEGKINCLRLEKFSLRLKFFIHIYRKSLVKLSPIPFRFRFTFLFCN